MSQFEIAAGVATKKTTYKLIFLLSPSKFQLIDQFTGRQDAAQQLKRKGRKMETFTITKEHIDWNGCYIGSDTEFDGDVVIEAGLGLVRFKSLSVKGSIVAEVGSGIKVDGDLTAGWNIKAGDGVTVGGLISTRGDLTTGYSVMAGGVMAGGVISAGCLIKVDGDLTAGVGIKAGEGLTVGGLISTGGDLTAGWNIKAGGVTARGAISAGLCISVGVTKA